MAFHYQNLIQEKDFQYEDMDKRYERVKDYTKICLREFKKKNNIITTRQLWKLAIASSDKAFYTEKAKKIYFNRQEKILIITNILFSDEEKFVTKLFSHYEIDLEKCYKLKDVLNELDRKDEDFLDGTMEGLVRYYIPPFDVIAKDLSMNVNNEFIIYKLMEIMYFNPSILEKAKQKNIGKR